MQWSQVSPRFYPDVLMSLRQGICISIEGRSFRVMLGECYQHCLLWLCYLFMATSFYLVTFTLEYIEYWIVACQVLGPKGHAHKKYQAVKLSPGGSFAPLRSPGAVYVRCRIREVPYTRGTVYARCRIHEVPYMRGAIYVRHHIHMVPYTCGAIYAWSRICMEPYMHGAVYAWSHILVVPACSPCSLSIPGSLELSWGLRKPPAHSPHFQLTPLSSSLPPLPPEHL